MWGTNWSLMDFFLVALICPLAFEYVKYWKPRGVTCTTDQKIPYNIIDEIQRDGYNPKHRVYPVGRLDKDTSGKLWDWNEKRDFHFSPTLCCFSNVQVWYYSRLMGDFQMHPCEKNKSSQRYMRCLWIRCSGIAILTDCGWECNAVSFDCVATCNSRAHACCVVSCRMALLLRL